MMILLDVTTTVTELCINKPLLPCYSGSQSTITLTMPTGDLFLLLALADIKLVNMTTCDINLRCID